MLVAADGQFEITTPLTPRALALRNASTASSMPIDGICAMPTRRLRVGRAELLEQEVVVRLDAGEHEVVVVVAEEVAHRALRREQDLGVDAVDVHVGQPRGAVVATGARLFVGDAVQRNLSNGMPGVETSPIGSGSAEPANARRRRPRGP